MRALLLSLATVCAFTAPAVRANLVKLDGSSTVFPVAEAVAEEFQAETKGKIRVTVGISGTGGGFKKFVRGEVDVQNASRPILAPEKEQARANGVEFIEIPICFDAITVVVHPKNDWVDSIKISELKKMWEPAAQGVILKWNQIRPEWPDREIKLFGAGSDSGTFDYFTEAVVGKAKSSRGDYTGSEDDNVLVQGVEGDRYAIGYLPFAYYVPHASRMKALAIEWDIDTHNGKPVGKPAALPTLENVVAGTYNPLARPLFVYVSKNAADSRQEVRDFVEFYIKHAGELSKEVGYLPLPETAYDMVLKRFQDRVTGTAFDGQPAIGVPVKELLGRTPVN